jgi:hypothetical protein
VSDRPLPDDEVDRLLREALADDLAEPVEEELRREARRAWRRATAGPGRAGWRDWLGLPTPRGPLLPQPVLVAAALAMLAAGAVMQAAPAPRGAVEAFEGRQASALVARALGGARAMECAVEVADERGRLLSYRIAWEAPGTAHVRLDGASGRVERTLRAPGEGPSLLSQAAVTRDDAPEDPVLNPARAYLSPAALGEQLAASWRLVAGGEGAVAGARTFFVGPRSGEPALTVTVDTATHLPFRLEGTDRAGRMQAAVCRWP